MAWMSGMRGLSECSWVAGAEIRKSPLQPSAWRGLNQLAYAIGGDSELLNALGPAALAGEDSNSRERDFQMLGQQASQRVVSATVHRRGGQTDLQRALPLAADGITAGPRLHAHDEDDSAAVLLQVEHGSPRLQHSITGMLGRFQPVANLDEHSSRWVEVAA